MASGEFKTAEADDVAVTVTTEKLRLYHHHHFRSSRCLWLIKEMSIEKDVEVIIQEVGTSIKDEKYIQHVHPHHTVPALQLPGQRMTILESGAVCLYLADVYQMLLPTASDKATYYNWILYACSSLDEWLETLYQQWCHTEVDSQDPEVISSSVSKVNVGMIYLDQHLKDRQFICGDRLTAADCVLGYNIWWASAMKDGRLIQGLTNVQAYLRRLMSRPAFQETFKLTL